MTDIDPEADIEFHSVDGHVTVRVPLAGLVTRSGLAAIGSSCGLRTCPRRRRHVVAGPGSWYVFQPAATRGR